MVLAARPQHILFLVVGKNGHDMFQSTIFNLTLTKRQTLKIVQQLLMELLAIRNCNQLILYIRTKTWTLFSI